MAFGCDLPAMLLHNFIADRQAQTQTVVLGREERLEDAADVLGQNAGACVADAHVPVLASPEIILRLMSSL